MAVRSVQLAKWREIHRFARNGWLYRGQASASRPMANSLERCLDRFQVVPTERVELERRLIREFQRAYHQYAQHVPPDEAAIEWLSLMQHHGAPTRLLDFTYSIYVAAYFALERADDDAVIWAVNGPWAVQESARLLDAAGKADPRIVKEGFLEHHEALARNWFFEAPLVAVAYPINPYRLNERLRIQRGVFMIVGDVTKSFMDNLSALPDADSPQHVVKIVIPAAQRLTALSQLFYMGIARSSLFPGLDGYAQSLGVFHSAYDPTKWTGRAAAMSLPRGLSGATPSRRLKPPAHRSRKRGEPTRLKRNR